MKGNEGAGKAKGRGRLVVVSWAKSRRALEIDSRVAISVAEKESAL